MNGFEIVDQIIQNLRTSVWWYLLLLLFGKSVVSDLLRPHGLQLARLLCPWDFPGKNPGGGCHFLFQGSFQPRDWTDVCCTGRRILYHWATWEAMISTIKLKDWEVILAVYVADKRLTFEIQNPHKTIRERQLRKQWAKDINMYPIKRKPEYGQHVFEKMLRLTNTQDK